MKGQIKWNFMYYILLDTTISWKRVSCLKMTHSHFLIHSHLPVFSPWSTDLDGVIPNVVLKLQLYFSCSYLPLIFLSTNQNIQLIQSLLIRIEWTTGNGILMSSSHWPIYNKFPPGATSYMTPSPHPINGNRGYSS